MLLQAAVQRGARQMWNYVLRAMSTKTIFIDPVRSGTILGSAPDRDCLAASQDFRRVATRYDKLAANFLSGMALATATTFWR